MKRAAAVVCAILLILLNLVGFAQAESVNLLKNGGFETLTAAGEPADWYATAYKNQAGYSRLTATDEKVHSGQYSVVIENASSNDARYTCTVKVQPESLYKLSGYVLVDSMQDVGNGANFGIEGIYAFSECLFDTQGEWKYLEWYGETGEDQKELTFGVRVGGYSAESIGKAYFDDISLEKVEELPDGIFADVWYDAYSGSSSSQQSTATETEGKSTAWFVVFGIAFALLYFFLRPVLSRFNEKQCTLAFVLIMAVAFVIRVILAMNVAGYEVDINCFTAWSMRMARGGPANFYAPDYFCDYPPGAMLLLWPIGGLLHLAGTQNTEVALLIVKLLPMLCDLLGGWCIWHYAKKHIAHLPAVVLAVLYLFNPAVLVNGAAWGQMDSVLALMIVLTTLCAMQHDWIKAIVLFAVSALVKPQALLFAPLGGMWLLFDLFSTEDRKKLLKQIGLGIVLAIAAALIIVAPFSIHQKWNWLFELYGETLSSYAYATLNTANLYYLIGANWAGLTQHVPSLLMIVTMMAALVLGAALLYSKTQSKLCKNEGKAKVLACVSSGMVIVQLGLFFLKADYALYGYAMMAFVYLFAILCLAYDRKQGALPFYMALALMGVYVLGVKVHERYLFPALALLLLCYIRTQDRRMLVLMVGFSVTTFINTAIVLDNSILFGAAQGHLNSDTLVLNQILCVCNLLLCAFGGWMGLTGLKASKPLEVAQKQAEYTPPASYVNELLHSKDHRMHLRWQDYLIMAVTTIAYTVLTFSHLGSTVAPQTAWVSTSADEAVILELEEAKPFSVLYYAGVSYYDFSIQVSDDGVNWSEEYPCEMREGLCYRWMYAVNSKTENGNTTYSGENPSNVLWLNGKYLRVNACNAGLNLWEVVARDKDGSNIPLKLLDNPNAKTELLDEAKPASNLIDELETCVGEPGWFTGTYFDEIYHARTGYEHLHGIAPYETTHPPLGKLMMSAGIALFGMTPFGWRFAGALIGVLMLPALYLLSMQLTRKRSIAMVSMLAFTLDLMHFTQTRIATIDSFPVFFILLSYLFMVRYMQMDAFEVSDPEHPALMDRAFLKTLVPLLLSGICMGLSIASKWIGIYSAVGLAVLFFLTVFRHYRISNTAFDVEASGDELSAVQTARVQTAQRFTLNRILITCGFCVLFFILIPGLIYYLCYIPYLAPTGPVTLKRVINAQIGMLNYHATPGLGMDHPFQSPWWQWPFILKPIWFAQDHFEPAGYASTILCMGNPWVFYIGAFAMAALLICTISKYIRIRNGRLALERGNGDLTLVIVAVAFMAQYLPWVLVPRSMYIYHYFASVPFIILATAWMLDRLPKDRPALRYGVMAAYIVGALVFFILFFPYASGYLTSTEWLNAMKWFPRIYY